MLNVCKRCSECKYICKENKRIIKADKLQTLGISFSIPSGDHGTVRAQGSLENTKWAWGPYRRWSRHPNKSRDTLTATGFHGRYPEAVFRDRVWKLGMGFIWPTQPFGWPPCVFIFYYLWLLSYFLITVWFARISLLFYLLCTLVILMLLTLGMNWQLNGKYLQTYIPNKWRKGLGITNLTI